MVLLPAAVVASIRANTLAISAALSLPDVSSSPQVSDLPMEEPRAQVVMALQQPAPEPAESEAKEPPTAKAAARGRA